MIDKRALRARMRAVRDGATPAPILVPEAFRARLAQGMTVASYIPVGAEADPAPLTRTAVEAGCVIALPHVTSRAAPIRFLAWEIEAALVAGPFGLRQPVDQITELTPDIILTPLVGFDRRGNRLGQGAGHYDRAFAALPDAWRVGVALGVQETEDIAADPWDMPLHAIATDHEWIIP